MYLSAKYCCPALLLYGPINYIPTEEMQKNNISYGNLAEVVAADVGLDIDDEATL